ncbi:MAG: valine--tRNA ligase [Actinomycetota bacterium]
MTDELSTAYNPTDIEARWYEAWEKQGLFRARPNPGRKPYTIVIPPPNVTGVLHMGHGLNNTLQDVIVRRARMEGYETLWLPGTDHAGIATQNVVERELAKEGLDRHQLGREKFVKRVWEWKEQYGSRMIEQLRRLGCSCDWERERFTMDEGLSYAVRTVFVRWFDDGLIYRGNRIINWCPRCTTALSDIEVDHEDVAGELVTFRYELTDKSGSIPVATTRVETMLGDTGIAVHPDDERYADLVGKKVTHPFFPDRELPIVADDAVDPEFGSGAVKVTPAHDPTDFDIGERAGLEKINILDEEARTNDAAGQFRGMDRYEARQVVLHELRELGLVDSEERPYVHPVGHCSRCGTEIEPWLSEQWFVRMESLARPAIAAVREGRVRFEPERFAKQYTDWLESIRDWCISRQLWWGHRIPVWYCDDCGEAFASLDDPTECKHCKSGAIRQDPDVLDTWFSSQLWPFSTLGWPDQNEDLAYFYPTTVLVTAYEILYLWVARMVMSGLYFMDDIPFHRVLIHGIVRDFEGKKMSKSKGNVIDPLVIIERYGADALRFSLTFAAVPGNDTNVSEERIEGSRNFANKLWNASRFVLLSLGDERPELADGVELAPEDRWILSRLDHTIEEIDRDLAVFNFAEAMRVLHHFIWSEYCDWYIELAKLRLAGDGTAPKAVLLHVLDRILRLLHPVMPFVTEELWSRIRPEAGSIMVATWPEPEDRRDAAIDQAVERFQDLVSALRRLKADHSIPQSQRVSASVVPHGYEQELGDMNDAVLALARLESLDVVSSLDADAASARTMTPSGIEAAIDLGGAVDRDVECARLRGKLAEAESDIARAEGKLDNEQFISKAPDQIIEKERRKLDEARTNKAKLEAQLSALGC